MGQAVVDLESTLAATRGLTPTRKSPSGLKVIEGKGFTKLVETRRKEMLCAIVAKINVASIIAKPLPMQLRGPALNGK